MVIRLKNGVTAHAIEPGRMSIPDARAETSRSSGIGREWRAEDLYARALHQHLAGWPAKEINFFVNGRRFAQLERLIGRELTGPGCRVLNVASGPFALEFYLGLNGRSVVSFDREPRLKPLHHELEASGLIGPSRFSVASAEEFMPPHAFDAVVINDLFYSKFVDFYDLIPRYIACLAPGGLIYFDIQDERAGPIWRAFGKDGEFRRYDLKSVERVLGDAGLRIEAIEPGLGIKGGIDGIVRRGLWRTTSIANSFVFVARKP